MARSLERVERQVGEVHVLAGEVAEPGQVAPAGVNETERGPVQLGGRIAELEGYPSRNWLGPVVAGEVAANAPAKGPPKLTSSVNHSSLSSRG